jgi:ceramide glucosyltransferase
MISSFSSIVGILLAAATMLYACFALVAVWRGRVRGLPPASRGDCPETGLEPVSILKPLCGNEPRLYENLRSFCVQSHPAFQLICGVRDPRDPAIAVVRRLQAEFPAVDLQLVIDPRVHGTNLKVSNLLNLLPLARHDRLVLTDSDIGVGPDYLRRVTAPLADPGVGVVTCLYRGVAGTGLWSRLGAQFIDEWFIPSVEVAHALGSTRFSFGSTLALRRDVLEAAGGLEALNNLLADDFWLGEFSRRQGFRTVLSDVWVTTDVTDDSLADLWAHELRWQRTIRAVAPVGFAFTFVTFPFPVLALGLALAPSALCLAIALIGAAARIGLHYVQRRRTADRTPAGSVLLLPWRDSLLLAGWAVAHTGSRVRWRTHLLDAAVEPGLVGEG